MADNTYTKISDLPTLESVDQTAWTPVEIEGNEGKKVDLSKFADKDELDGKADKAQMSISAVSGDSTKKTIQLKEGTSADVVVAHQDVTGKADKVSDAVSGNIPKLDGNGNLVDSGISSENVVTSMGYKKVNLGLISPIDTTVTIPVHERETILALIHEETTRDITNCIIQCDPNVTDAIITLHNNGLAQIGHTRQWLSVQTTSGIQFPIIYRELDISHEWEAYDAVIHGEADGSGQLKMPTDWDDDSLGGYNIYVPTNSNIVISSHPLQTSYWCVIQIKFPFAFYYLYGNHTMDGTPVETINPELLWN